MAASDHPRPRGQESSRFGHAWWIVAAN